MKWGVKKSVAQRTQASCVGGRREVNDAAEGGAGVDMRRVRRAVRVHARPHVEVVATQLGRPRAVYKWDGGGAITSAVVDGIEIVGGGLNDGAEELLASGVGQPAFGVRRHILLADSFLLEAEEVILTISRDVRDAYIL